jgi:hypothetical protein
MRTVVIACAFLVLSLGAAPRANASGVAWGSIGAGCVPDTGTVGRYTTASGYITFAGSTTGTLSFYCPIGFISGALDNLTVTYEDSTSVAGNSVVVTYYQMAPDGTLTAIATFNSDSKSPITYISSNSALFSYTANPNGGYYFAAVYISRTSSAYAELFAGYYLADF